MSAMFDNARNVESHRSIVKHRWYAAYPARPRWGGRRWAAWWPSSDHCQSGDWTVGGDWSLNCGWRGRLFRGDWRRLRMRGRQTRGWWRPRLPRTPGTYLNLLMAARLSVKSVAFRLTGTIILCVIPSWENCQTRRGKLTAKIIFHDFAQEKNY